MKLKCYDKEINFKVPKIYCSFCRKYIEPGEFLYTVILTWGNGKSVCKECYDIYEIDWTMRNEIKNSKYSYSSSSISKSINDNSFKPIEFINKKKFMV